LAHLELPSNSIDFPINPWEKMCQNSIREQLHGFPISKEHWFTFRPAVVFVTLGALLLAG
jgi:hypothetical protein